jgi:hypothetical protein
MFGCAYIVVDGSPSCRCIAQNYSHIRDVEKELTELQLQLKLTAGPKKSALEMLRKKIEDQNDRVVLARAKSHAARKVCSSDYHAVFGLCLWWLDTHLPGAGCHRSFTEVSNCYPTFDFVQLLFFAFFDECLLSKQITCHVRQYIWPQ